MGDRRSSRGRRQGRRRTDPRQADERAIVVNGWTIFAHALFVKQIEKLTAAAEQERQKHPDRVGPNGKLLGHLIDLAFNKIPQNPGNPAYRQGNTLGEARKAWFRAKTGNGRYRLFFRFQSKSRMIVYAWVNDEQTLRTYSSNSDAYAVFARMLDDGNPPPDWDALLEAAQEATTRRRLGRLNPRPASAPPGSRG